MDGPRDGVPPLNDTVPVPCVDLHLHSTASDGAHPPEEVVHRAARAGLAAIALTDHDTLAGLPAALAAGEAARLRVIPGCEFSVQAAWGEMHLLGYFLPVGWAPLEEFLVRARDDRARRGGEMVDKLRALGADIALEDVLAEAAGGAIGRPHVARALVKVGAARTVQDAFDRYVGWGRPGFVEKRLPAFKAVATLVHQAGGVVSAAHLKERGTRNALAALKAEGLDAVEVRHPTHDADLRSRLAEHARQLGLRVSGGSDWHGEDVTQPATAAIGGQQVPLAWLEALEAARPRVAAPVD